MTSSLTERNIGSVWEYVYLPIVLSFYSSDPNDLLYQLAINFDISVNRSSLSM